MLLNFFCGDCCTRKFSYIFLSIFFLLLYRIFVGLSFDKNSNYQVKIFDNKIFSNHFLIHEIYKYLFCIIVSCVLILVEKISQKINMMKQNNQNKENNENSLNSSFTLVTNLTLIYKERFEKNKSNYPKLFIFSTFFLYIILDQMANIFGKFFSNMNFWMIGLYIVAFLNKKIFNIEIYKHHKVSFAFIFISLLLNIINVILTIIENREDKGIYVKYIWSLIIAVFIYSYYIFFLPCSFINIKELMDLNFISFNIILLFYGIFGFVFCILFCTVTTFTSMKKDNYIAKYLFKIEGDNNQIFIDNFLIYFRKLFSNEIEDAKYIKNEIFMIFSSMLSYALYKIFTLKVIEELTILHKIFCYPLYYFGQKIIIIFVNINKLKDVENYPKAKFIISIISDIFSVIGYLIYLEIVEINIFNLNNNLRRNIMARMARSNKEDFDLLKKISFSTGDDVSSEKSKDKHPLMELEVYN